MEPPARYDDHLVCVRCDYTSPNHDEFIAELCQACDTEVLWQCHKDGTPKGAKHATFDLAWMAMHHLQGQSVAWATRFEGWTIEMVEEEEGDGTKHA